MILGIDIDGVLGNYLNLFIKHAREIGFFKDQPNIPILTKYKFDEWGIDGEDYLKVERYLVENNGYRYMELLETTSPAFFKRMSEEGHKIKFITSRLGFRRSAKEKATLKKDTKLWVKKHFGECAPELIFTENKKDIYADLYVEDSPKFIKQLLETKKIVCVYDLLYNREINTGIERISSILEIEKFIK